MSGPATAVPPMQVLEWWFRKSAPERAAFLADPTTSDQVRANIELIDRYLRDHLFTVAAGIIAEGRAPRGSDGGAVDPVAAPERVGVLGAHGLFSPDGHSTGDGVSLRDAAQRWLQLPCVPSPTASMAEQLQRRVPGEAVGSGYAARRSRVLAQVRVAFRDRFPAPPDGDAAGAITRCDRASELLLQLLEGAVVANLCRHQQHLIDGEPTAPRRVLRLGGKRRRPDGDDRGASATDRGGPLARGDEGSVARQPALVPAVRRDPAVQVAKPIGARRGESWGLLGVWGLLRAPDECPSGAAAPPLAANPWERVRRAATRTLEQRRKKHHPDRTRLRGSALVARGPSEAQSVPAAQAESPVPTVVGAETVLSRDDVRFAMLRASSLAAVEGGRHS